MTSLTIVSRRKSQKNSGINFDIFLHRLELLLERAGDAVEDVSPCTIKKRWQFLILIGDSILSPMLMELCLQETFGTHNDLTGMCEKINSYVQKKVRGDHYA